MEINLQVFFVDVLGCWLDIVHLFHFDIMHLDLDLFSIIQFGLIVLVDFEILNEVALLMVDLLEFQLTIDMKLNMDYLNIP